ncbi:MAG TPA: dipicolinate synthase subunit DpsA [Syntrophomonadaceae bacterium]|nr:dipicolinate synthase subunit DpsA [Syntrophomonadaceae bacterium]
MGLDLRGIKVAVIGGDKRDIYFMPELVRMGADVTAVGFPACPELEQVHLAQNIKTALKNAQVVIFPMSGSDPNGNIKTLDDNCHIQLTASVAELIPPGTLVIIGFARDFMRNWADKYRWKLVEIGEMDSVAILNSIPSAEGAIQIAMEKLPITIHDSNSFVLGFGRLGKTLARMLRGIGAHVTVVARKRSDLARAFEMGYRPLVFTRLQQHVSEADIIFNTVPALVLDEKMLIAMKKDVFIVDLAAAPGGTDFVAANRLGVNAVLAPGLPGIVAPKTSGKILAQVIPQLILREIPQEYF